ncbi:MAG: alpha/beta fold hydrolase [Deltaproteobacteria bacterium]|nr:alpha/beta fold hydrolase [Deltaproteobacteria bacterium]
MNDQVRRELVPVEAADGAALRVERSWVVDVDPADAPAVVLCHGFVQNRYGFESPRRSLAAFLRAAGAVVWHVELRGRDGTRAAAGLHEYLDVDAPAAVAAVRERHDEVGWVGHSMGGLVGALTPASTSLAAVVALGSPLFPGPRRLHGLARALIGPARAAHKSGRPFLGTRWGALLLRLRRGLDVERVPAPIRLWAPGELDDEALAAMLRDSFAEDSWAVFADLLELIATDARRAGSIAVAERLAALSTPLLVVAGGADHLAPPSGTRPLFERAGSRDKHYLEVSHRHTPASLGHIDLVVGDRAPALVWQPALAFLRRHLRLRDG